MGESLTPGEIGFTEAIIRSFGLSDVDPSQYSPLVLAYIGDNVYECVNRTVSVIRADKQVEKLNKECSARANARAQAQVFDEIEGLLSDEELRIYKRGRNAEVYTKAKNMTMADYHKATGLEALVGYLYLLHRYDRITDLLKTGWEKLDLC